MPPPPLLRPRLSAANLLQDSTPPTPATPQGFRAQINHFLPRHSYFRARVYVHQLDSVPFVNGQFAVRWKFKQVHSLPGSNRAGLLGIVKTRHKGADKRLVGLLKDDASLGTTSSSTDPLVPSLIVSTNSTDSSSSNDTTRLPSFSTTSSTSSSSIPSALNAANTHLEPLTTLAPSVGPTNSSSTTLHIHLPNARVCPASSPVPPLLDSSLSTATTTTVTSFDSSSANTPSKGHTSYNELQEHSVQWNQTLSTVVRLDVDRDNGYIFPCPFKLVVMQKPSDRDQLYSTGNTPEIHRLGALYLNLSEYVGHGSVERRYLLRESKTNATLKLTIEMEFLSGERNYIPPPLPKGEILNGLSGYLEGELSKSTLTGPHHRHGHRLLNHGIDLYGPYSNQEDLELDLFGTRCPNEPRTIASLNRSRSRGQLARAGAEEEDLDSELEDGNQRVSHDQVPLTPTAGTPQSQTPVKPTFFDVERLPMAYGTKTTETLIEAIFNPVKTNEERCESPFTVYVPAAPTTALSQPINGVSEYAPRPNSRRQIAAAAVDVASVYSTESSSTSSGSAHSGQSAALSRSVHSQISQTSQGSTVSAVGDKVASERNGGGRVKDWWKKTVGSSRPGTPAGLQT